MGHLSQLMWIQPDSLRFFSLSAFAPPNGHIYAIVSIKAICPAEGTAA